MDGKKSYETDRNQFNLTYFLLDNTSSIRGGGRGNQKSKKVAKIVRKAWNTTMTNIFFVKNKLWKPIKNLFLPNLNNFLQFQTYCFYWETGNPKIRRLRRKKENETNTNYLRKNLLTKRYNVQKLGKNRFIQMTSISLKNLFCSLEGFSMDSQSWKKD